MDARRARRAAEKAACDMINDRAAVVGELAVAASARETAHDAVTAARAAGEELIASAKAKAAQLIDAAQRKTADLDAQYNDARTAAITTGWRGAELDRLGYRTPTRRRSATDTATPATVEPEQSAVA